MFQAGLKSLSLVGAAGTSCPLPPSLAFEAGQTLRICFITITPLLDYGFWRSGLRHGILTQQEGDKERSLLSGCIFVPRSSPGEVRVCRLINGSEWACGIHLDLASKTSRVFNRGQRQF